MAWVIFLTATITLSMAESSFLGQDTLVQNTPAPAASCDDPSMPKCLSFSAEGRALTPTCSEVMRGYTLGDGRAPGGRHVFAYTHGFCGPTGKGGVDATEAAWCRKVAGECGLAYPSAQWRGKAGATCLVKHIVRNTPSGAHFEIDNCSQYGGGDVQCYRDILAAMRAENIGDRRLVLKNLTATQSAEFASLLKGPDSRLFSNFMIVEEEFNKASVQRAFAGTCMSVAKSGEPGSQFNTENYGVNENHISMAGQRRAEGRPADSDASR